MIIGDVFRHAHSELLIYAVGLHNSRSTSRYNTAAWRQLIAVQVLLG